MYGYIVQIVLLLIIISAISLAIGMPLKRAFAKRAASNTAQINFRKKNHSLIRDLVGGTVDDDPRKNTPWIGVELASTTAVLTAAKISNGHYQAGIKLLEFRSQIQIWDTGLSTNNIDYELIGNHSIDVLTTIEEFKKLNVDSFSIEVPYEENPPLIRVQFNSINDLPALFIELTKQLHWLETNGLLKRIT